MIHGCRAPIDSTSWSKRWAPYSNDTYHDGLAALTPGQLVLDIGAGDLRFARMAAAAGCRVIAVEMQAGIVGRGLSDGPLPDGVTVVTADARDWPFPQGINAAVLLMRHCDCYGHYVAKLRSVGCPVLITNARWGLGVEVVPLAPAAAYCQAQMGWYACVRCGATGFIPGDPALLTPEVEQQMINVEGCPMCCNH